MKKAVSISGQANPNYLASIQKIESVEAIPNADRLVKTTISGYDTIIPKDMQVGSLVVYFPVESCICEKFLSANNLFERSEFERNTNAGEVKKLVAEAETETDETRKAEILTQIRSMCGFFNSKGRVRILKLRGEYSQGFVAGIDSLVRAFPELSDVNFEELVGTQFDTVGDEKVCWKYVPVVREPEHTEQKHWKQRMKRLQRFDRIVPGTFAFHYDTTMLAEHIQELSPEDQVSISVKVHGTSAIFANIPVNRKLSTWDKVRKFFGAHVQLTEYGNVYSSRSVIKNRWAREGADENTDIWSCVNRVVAPLIGKDMTVYGEIVGYLENSQKMIQKNHDYGCVPGHWKFMPYRIVTRVNDRNWEWNLPEVQAWTLKLMREHKELEDKLMPPVILYTGKLKDLYPGIKVDDQWHKNLLEMLKTDQKKDDQGHHGWCMEMREPLCKNKVPREGIVVRILNDPTARAWKLKTRAHYGLEALQHDSEEADMEELA